MLVILKSSPTQHATIKRGIDDCEDSRAEQRHVNWNQEEDPMMFTRRTMTAVGAVLAISSFVSANAILAQQVPAPQTAAEVTAPAMGVVMFPEYAKAIGRVAYVWGWPLVNQINRRAAITQAPEPGRLTEFCR